MLFTDSDRTSLLKSSATVVKDCNEQPYNDDVAESRDGCATGVLHLKETPRGRQKRVANASAAPSSSFSSSPLTSDL
ncbi:unnamed protein product [Caenorhabditis auriculariae]|uniref:Uncharacterized protein n=1 Tax=Caenorhabditis auriculariae TaxID=2777116 RepID=A0A8S1HMB6_9PELO|nr:unnamed protein product [Caenorhabditis auriculariae]